MSWVVAGLLAPLLWAVTNIADQIMMRKFYVGQPLLLMAISGLVSFFPFIIIAVFNTEIFAIDKSTAFIFILSSIVNSCGLLAYFKALELDEASNAVPIFQLQPIFIFVAAYFLFDEVISFTQSIGVFIIIISALCISIDFKNKKYNWRTLYLIGLCGIVLSSTTILDRHLLQEEDWLTAMAWKSLGYVFFFILVFLGHSKTRIKIFEKLKKPVINGTQFLVLIEIIAIVANLFFLISLDTTPSAGLTQTLTGFMPLFVLILGYLGYRILPQHIKQPKQGLHLTWHLACLSTMLIGLYLIY